MKKVYISKKYGIKEQAIRLADIDARLKGYKKGSPQWEKMVHKFIDDRIKNSSTPFIKNPNGTKSLIKENPIREENFELTKKDFNALKSSFSSIVNVFLKNNMGLGEKDSFGFPNMKKLSENERINLSFQVVKNRYARRFIQIYLETLLSELFFKVTRNDVDSSLKNLLGEKFNDPKNYAELMTKRISSKFEENLENDLKNFFKTIKTIK